MSATASDHLTQISADNPSAAAQPDSSFHAEPPAAGPCSQPTAVQKLNAMDCTMLAVDAAVRADGAPGFHTQALVWLEGRIDVDQLALALRRLARRYPVMTSRLERRGWRSDPHWVPQSPADCRFSEIELHADDRTAVFRCTSELLSQEIDLRREAPVRFYLLHRESAGDVFVVQYSHVLMDNPAIAGLLQEIDRLSRDEADVAAVPPTESRDPLADYVAAHSRRERWRAAWNTVYLRLAGLRSGIASFGGRPESLLRPLPLHVAVREMEAVEVAELSSRVTAACRFPGLSMALLASVFRTGRRLGFANPPDGRFTTGIGLELDLRTGNQPLFQNLSSVVPLVAEPAEMQSREELTRLLNAQMRERLQQGIDLGVIALSSALCRRRKFMGLAMKRLMQRGYSVWYAYFGSSDGIRDNFLGVPIENYCYFGPSWPSVGITIIANQFRGRLQLHATYVRACVSDSRAEAFLDALLEELRGWSR